MRKLVFPKQLEPMKGAIYFVVIVLSAHFFWKYFVLGDETDTIITFLGWDISAPFNYASTHVAQISHWLLNKIGYQTTLNSCNVIRHTGSGHSAQVVWGCTGIKQAYIFFCIIAFYYGSWKHKLWYIPLGFLLIYLVNLARITLLLTIIEKHPNSFHFWHEEVTKYLFYIFLFLLWVVWNEVFVLRKRNRKTL